ncbi:MAG TPA: hypothetical protein VKR32_06375 [Puia sp.]|nr:hypothetical protein [Puia sp.]
MGKKWLLFLLVIACSMAGQGQYTVTKVIGHVTKKNGEPIVTGTVINDNDELQYSSPNDMVRAIVPGKGIYVFNPGPNAEKKQNRIVEVLRSTMRVRSKEGYLSGRNSSMETVPDAFDLSMGDNKKILVADTNRYLFDHSRYPVQDGSRFVLQINRDNDKPLIRVLETQGDTLFIYSQDFSPGRAPATTQAHFILGYYSKPKRSTEALTEISPYFDSSGDMTTIIKAIVRSEKKNDASSLQSEAYAEVWLDLGKPSDIDFQRVFSSEFAAGR